MAIILILFSFLSLVVVFRIYRYDRNCLRSAFLEASVIHGVIIAVITEALSLNKSLLFGYFVAFWSLLALINSAFLMLLIYRKRTNLDFNQFKLLVTTYFRQDSANLIAILGVILVLSICLLTALVVPPHNYDSMTYHLPRVMHWIQNGSVAHYPTHNLRQISFPPGASYIVTHLQILSGGDRFANCVQWFAFLGSIIGTSLIAKNLGFPGSQNITALVCSTIPMAIMQSTTPQTDLVISFWLVCFAYFIFRRSRYSKLDLFWLSASLALAILAKPTGIIFGIPFLMVLGLRMLANYLEYDRPWKAICRSIILTGGILIASISLSLPSYWRNFQTFGSFLGIDTGTRNTSIGLIELISNVLRNLALNMPLPAFWKLVENIHKYILKIDVNAPEITIDNSKSFNYNYIWWKITLPDENYVGNPVHLTLIFLAILSIVSVVVLRKNRNLSDLLLLAIGNSMGFLLFCLLLKWQEWGNRLLLPFFILCSPLIGYFISRFLVNYLQRILVILIIFMAILYSINPIYTLGESIVLKYSNLSVGSILKIKPEDAYFRGAGIQIKNTYVKLSDEAVKNNCNTIGLKIGSDDWEYPIWPLMAAKGLPVRIKHLNVENESHKLPPEFPDSEVCVIFNIR